MEIKNSKKNEKERMNNKELDFNLSMMKGKMNTNMGMTIEKLKSSGSLSRLDKFLSYYIYGLSFVCAAVCMFCGNIICTLSSVMVAFITYQLSEIKKLNNKLEYKESFIEYLKSVIEYVSFKSSIIEMKDLEKLKKEPRKTVTKTKRTVANTEEPKNVVKKPRTKKVVKKEVENNAKL